MEIKVCPSCGGRLVADIRTKDVMIRCNACGQELGTFTRADYAVKIDDSVKIFPAEEREE